MKKFFTLFMASLIAIASLAQTKTRVPDEVLNKAVEMSNRNTNNVQMPFKVAPSTKSVALAPQEIEVGHTYYDLQSNSSLANRFYRYDDGSIVATWTGGMEAAAFNDRGSFSTYWTKLQDQTWGWSINPDDVGRIEGYRAGWPSYAPYENGEIMVSHSSGIGLHKRDQVGTGDWSLVTQSISSTSNSWPRACVNNGTIHVLEGHQTSGTPMENHVYYSRSKDGGQTWAPQGETPELIGSDYYSTIAFSADDYVWAEPNNGVIAFAMFSNFADLVIMKSEDDGDTWEKIIAWEHPIPFYNYNTMVYTDTLYAPNGSGNIVIDDNGNCHIAFNVNRYLVTETGGSSSYFPALGHSFYWNETLDPFTDLNNQYDALHAELHPEYLQDGRCILAYGFDFDGDGSWFGETTDGLTYYRCTGPITHITMTQVSADRLVIAISLTDDSAPLSAGGSTYYAKRIFLCSYVFNEIYEEWRFDTNWVTDPDMVSYDLFSETPT
ncbi:MAG: glycoside hydrolase, partial [Bacteroidales bacterium]|nr:glycoside hydrolase [Bacteroidales bacterium]